MGGTNSFGPTAGDLNPNYKKLTDYPYDKHLCCLNCLGTDLNSYSAYATLCPECYKYLNRKWYQKHWSELPPLSWWIKIELQWRKI